MQRFFQVLRWDIALQWRNGFYAATIFVTVFWAILLLQAPPMDWAWLLPPMLIGNLLIGTFYFIGALILLERDEGALRARVVTPLHFEEYLAARVLSLSVLVLLETVIIVVLVRGVAIDFVLLLAAVSLAAVIYCLAGCIAVVRYPSINAFLLPSGMYIALLWIPLLAYLANWRPGLLYLHPLSAPLALAEVAVNPAPWWYVPYGLAYSLFWIVVLAAWSRRAFRSWLIERV